MLNKITLINFQIHKKLEVELHKRLNVIIGSNDHGKSSIIRAIHWVFYNEPSGDWMCRIDEKGQKQTATVKLFFDDNTIIVRKKGEDANLYKVDDEEFKNFGYGVPEQVLKKLELVPFKTNKKEFNLHVAMQDEQPFLIHESGPVKASVLDVLTGNSLLQKAIVSFNKENIQATKDRKRLLEIIEEDKEAIKSIPDLDSIENKIKEIEVLQINSKKLSDEIITLKDKESALAAYEKIINTLQTKINLNPIKIDIERRDILSNKLEVLQNIQNQIETYNKAIISIPDVLKLVIKVDRYIKLKSDLGQLKELEEAYFEQRKILKSNNQDIEDLENKVKQYYKENPSCPECGRKW